MCRLRDDVAVNARPDAPEKAAPALKLERLGLVVHPRREIDTAMDNARAWAFANGAQIVQIKVSGQERVVADPGEVASCDLVLAIGGDGTALHALHAAAKVNRPVLGVACGSLGALTATAAEDLPEALDSIAAGTWSPRRLPGLQITGTDGLSRVAVNDVVVVRRGANQIIVGIYVDDQLYVRYAGDGIVVATPAGSSAYTLAAGGPVLAERSDGIVLTPLAPHGGCCPPLVVGSTSSVRLEIEPGYGGARMELDGQAEDKEPTELSAARVEDYATLVGLGDSEPLLAGLRRRRILIDSPRVLARDEREALRGS
ncbi:MAG: kinase [Solirubrobacteraceae bacterium]|nr:kinase [Solirubrobacteraceae bacterium]